MINIPFFTRSQRKYLGVDVGSSSIRVVELSGKKGNVTLENYAEMSISHLTDKMFFNERENKLSLSSEDVAETIKSIMKEAGIRTKKAYFAIPDFVSFFTSFNLPAMKEEEIASAVQFHSRQYIPLSLSEVVLDWSIAEDKKPKKAGEDIEITLVAVPNEVIEQYQDIARRCSLDIGAMEGEVFGLSRSLAKNKPGIMAIADMGAQSTTISIIDEGILKTTHSLDIAGNMLADQVASSLRMDYNEALEYLIENGLKEESIKQSVTLLMESFFSEINRVFRSFQRERNKKIEKIMFAGGVSTLPGFADYAAGLVDVGIEEADCFNNISHPPALRDVLKEISPLYAIATGMALRGIEEAEEE